MEYLTCLFFYELRLWCFYMPLSEISSLWVLLQISIIWIFFYIHTLFSKSLCSCHCKVIGLRMIKDKTWLHYFLKFIFSVSVALCVLPKILLHMNNSVILDNCRTYTRMTCISNGSRMASACWNLEGSAISLLISFSSTLAFHTTTTPWKFYYPLPWSWLPSQYASYWDGGGWGNQSPAFSLLGTTLTRSPFHLVQASVTLMSGYIVFVGKYCSSYWLERRVESEIWL